MFLIVSVSAEILATETETEISPNMLVRPRPRPRPRSRSTTSLNVSVIVCICMYVCICLHLSVFVCIFLDLSISVCITIFKVEMYHFFCICILQRPYRNLLWNANWSWVFLHLWSSFHSQQLSHSQRPKLKVLWSPREAQKSGQQTVA